MDTLLQKCQKGILKEAKFFGIILLNSQLF